MKKVSEKGTGKRRLPFGKKGGKALLKKNYKGGELLKKEITKMQEGV